MSSMSYDFDERFKYFFERDAFISPDPFKNSENYFYYFFVEKNNYSHIISRVIIRKDVSIEKNIWYEIIHNDIVMLDTSPERANEIKEELMPKDTNNFCPFRKNGTVVGYIIFSYQICGLKNELDEIKTKLENILNAFQSVSSIIIIIKFILNLDIYFFDTPLIGHKL